MSGELVGVRIGPYTAEAICERYLELVREAYLLEKGERLAELEGRRVAFRDSSGLNPVSYITGQYRELFPFVLAAIDGVSGDVELLLPHHLELRHEARMDAQAEHSRAIVREAFAEMYPPPADDHPDADSLPF